MVFFASHFLQKAAFGFCCLKNHIASRTQQRSARHPHISRYPPCLGISSWPLTPKLSSSLRIWCHLKFKFLGPSAQPRSHHMWNRPPLAWQHSAYSTGPTVIVLPAYLLCRKSPNVWRKLRYLENAEILNVSLCFWYFTKARYTKTDW